MKGVEIRLTTEQMEWLRANYKEKGRKACCEHLGIGLSSLVRIAKENGISVTNGRECYSRIDLMEKQEKYLKARYKNTTNAELSLRLGISESTLHRFARLFGLTKSKQFERRRQKNASEAALRWRKEMMERDPEGYRRIMEKCTANFKTEKSVSARFRKGHDILARMKKQRPRKYREMQERRKARMDELRKRDRLLVRMGREPETKLHNGLVKIGDPQRKRVYQVRGYLASRYGYVASKGHIREMYYTEATKRRPEAEEKYERAFKMRFLPFDAPAETEKNRTVIVVPDWNDRQGGLNITTN